MDQHSPSLRAEAIGLLREGAADQYVAERLNVPRGTVGWCLHEDHKARGEAHVRPNDCPRCLPREFDHHAYAYLPGLYLGDGHIVSKPRQHHLSIFCGDGWPGLIGGGRKRYEYPRYLFTNISDDIRLLCTDTLDGLGVEWTHCTRAGRPYDISVARKASVALMDAHVGPKH
ncbi:hypothetical protein ABT117_00825 [Streptomyces sp. NPDC002262]|uniref:hypothetical protein n=1 Tax=unclassified Streptomyces TaxID=2593676 RepID=UPI00331FAD2E